MVVVPTMLTSSSAVARLVETLEIHYKGKPRAKERILLGKEIIRKVDELELYE